jgi:glycerophosphoryl diester phosphodiesterase
VDGFAAQGPLLFAHRGAPREHVENTLPAFAAALGHGADVLELDVHMSADGHVVVSHDPDGRRVFGVDAAIATTRFADIKRWRVRHVPPGATDAGREYEPAALAEVLEAFPFAALNIDIKQDKPDMLPVLFDVIMGHAAEERVLLTSFSARTLARVRRDGYHGPLGMSRRDAALFVLGPRAPRLLPRRGAQRLQLPLRYLGQSLGTRSCIEKAHAAGLRIDYWVVNDPAEAERLLDLGADGVVTDEPAGIAAVFAHHVRTRGWRKRRALERTDPPSFTIRGADPNRTTLVDVFEVAGNAPTGWPETRETDGSAPGR